MAFLEEGSFSRETDSEEELVQHIFYSNKFKNKNLKSFEEICLGNIYQVFTKRMAIAAGKLFFVSGKNDLEHKIIKTIHDRIVSSSAIQNDTFLLTTKKKTATQWGITTQKHIPPDVQRSDQRVQYVIMEATKHHLSGSHDNSMLFVSVALGKEMSEYYGNQTRNCEAAISSNNSDGC